VTLVDRPPEVAPNGEAGEAVVVAVPIVDSPPHEQPVAWRHRHLLDVDVLSWADIELVMRTSDAMHEVLGRPIAKVPALRGRNVTILFYEASTRTRVSFEVAAKNLSADVVNIAAATSSVTKGESLVDTVRTVEALGADMLVMRHAVSGASYLAAETFHGSVLNGGDGWHAHPTQALLDLYTLRSRLPGPSTSVPSDAWSLAGRKIVILGDVLHSRVARSNILGLRTMGAHVTLVGPPTLIPRDAASLGVDVSHSMAALEAADVVYVLRMQRERMAAGAAYVPTLAEYAAVWGVTPARLRPSQLVMHPGPINRGVEIDPEVADSAASRIVDQVRAGLVVRMAVLYDLLAGPGKADSETALRIVSPEIVSAAGQEVA
jgi:aspartate carbamoyltransferase catalytic subunit